MFLKALPKGFQPEDCLKTTNKQAKTTLEIFKSEYNMAIISLRNAEQEIKYVY